MTPFPSERRPAMTSHKKTSGYVGPADSAVRGPALVTGRGRFSGDLAAAHWVRFVRSPVACGRIVGISAPAGAMVITAADVAALPPIAPMLHKFSYVPIAQPILAGDVVRFVGEPIAAVVAPSREAAEDIAERVTSDRGDAAARRCAGGAGGRCAAGAWRRPRQRDRRRPRQDGRLRCGGGVASRRVKVAIRSRRQNASPLEPRAAHAAYDPTDDRVTLTCATQMPHSCAPPSPTRSESLNPVFA